LPAKLSEITALAHNLDPSTTAKTYFFPSLHRQQSLRFLPSPLGQANDHVLGGETVRSSGPHGSYAYNDVVMVINQVVVLVRLPVVSEPASQRLVTFIVPTKSGTIREQPGAETIPNDPKQS
jgi:hypothetical protein